MTLPAVRRRAPVARRPTAIAPRDVECANLARAAVYDAGVRAVDAANACIGAIAPLDDDALAWLALLLVNVPVRDYAWERVDRDVARQRRPMDGHRPPRRAGSGRRAGDAAGVRGLAQRRRCDRIDRTGSRTRRRSGLSDGSSAPRRDRQRPRAERVARRAAAGSPRPVRRRRGRHGPRSRRARAVPPGRSIR